MNYVINISKLNLKINNNELLKDFNLKLPSCKRIGITGPSGCGKTTFLRSIILGKFPKGSDYEYFEINNIKNVRPRIGYIPQEGGLLPWFSLRRNLSFFVPRDKPGSNIEEDIRIIANELELNRCLDNFPDSLSGGEKQRGLLACSILAKPDIYIADEILTEVDLERKWKALNILSRAIEENNASLLLVSHDVEILVHLCDEIILLHDHPSKIINRYSIECPHPRSYQDIVKGSPQEIRNELLSSLENLFN
ncbi:Fe(3+) ions import ATP-binding protein FbpC 2 [subsurface metagenome]